MSVLRVLPRPSRPALGEARTRRRLVILLGCALALFLLYAPANQLVSERTRIGHLEARLALVSEENRKLSGEVERLQDPGQLELLARERLGWVRPGEQAYLMVEQADPVREPEPAEDSVWARGWDALVRLLRGGG